MGLLIMSYTKINKPTDATYTKQAFEGKYIWDDPNVSWDDPNVYWDGNNVTAYTKTAKPTSSVYTSIAKPT